MRIPIAIGLFSLAAFTWVRSEEIHVFTILLALGGVAVLASHFRPPEKK